MTFDRRWLVVTVVLFWTLTGCTISVNFSGASIPPEAETVSIDYFPNQSRLGTANMGQYFTDELKDKFISETNLSLTSGEGDLNFRGEIVQYQIKPMAVTGNEVAAQNRLSITVHVVYVNNIDSKFNYDTRFTQYKDFDSNLSIADVEEELVNDIVELLIQDIFNKAVVNW